MPTRRSPCYGGWLAMSPMRECSRNPRISILPCLVQVSVKISGGSGRDNGHVVSSLQAPHH